MQGIRGNANVGPLALHHPCSRTGPRGCAGIAAGIAFTRSEIVPARPGGQDRGDLHPRTVSFVISFGLWTRLNAEAAYVFGTMVMVDTFDPERIPTATWPPETLANKPFVIRELWTRLLIPPPVRRPCYAGEAWVCGLADDVLPATSDRWSWKSYLQDVGLAGVSVLTSSVLAWLFTRKRHRS